MTSKPIKRKIVRILHKPSCNIRPKGRSPRSCIGESGLTPRPRPDSLQRSGGGARPPANAPTCYAVGALAERWILHEFSITRAISRIARVFLVLISSCLPVVVPLAEEQQESRYEAENIKSFTLEAAIEYALKRNYDLILEKQRVRTSEARVAEARSGMYPYVSAALDYAEYEDHPYMTFENDRGGSVTVGYDIFTGGRVINGIRQSQYGLKSQEQAKRRTSQEIIFNVNGSFHGVLLAKELVKIQQENLLLAEQHLATARARYKVGEVSHYDVLRAEVEVANIKPEFVKVKNNVEVAENQFKFLLGLGLDGKIELVGEFEFKPAKVDPEKLVSRALFTRPELLQIESQIEAARAVLKAARAGYLPTISVNWTDAARENALFATDREEYDDYWIASISCNIPIFDGFLTRAKVRQAGSMLDELRTMKEKLTQSVKLEVKNSTLALQAEEEMVEAQAKNVEKAQEGYEAIEKRYNHGKCSQLDLLDAKVTVTRAKMNHAQSIYDHIVARAALAKAIGVDEL